jgi:hypothetical protein
MVSVVEELKKGAATGVTWNRACLVSSNCVSISEEEAAIQPTASASHLLSPQSGGVDGHRTSFDGGEAMFVGYRRIPPA